MIKLKNHCVIPFGFRKGNTEHFGYQLKAMYSLLINLLNTRDQKKLSTFIVDRHWRESRLPRLAKVLLCLIRVGVS